MDAMALVFRLLIITLFSTRAVILLYAYKKRQRTYHLIGIACWCIHVVAFTIFVMLYMSHILTVSTIYLNMWSSTVRLHGGIVCLATAVYFLKVQPLRR